jgi:non-specific protein-tyrosine kinase
MSEIKKALEKAKKDRELFSVRALEQSHGESSPQDIQAPARTTLVEGEIQSQTSSDITPPVYSQTRTVQVDRQRLITERVFSILEKDRVADQYKLLRTMILNKTRPLKNNTIEITSFKEQEGKSLTCVNLAIALAKETRQTVLLVDMDLRRPSIHEILGIDISPGLKDYFFENVPLKDILVHPDIETLTVLPAGGRIDNSTEIIGSHRMEQLVLEIKRRYQDRYILFDTPALDKCADALVLSSYVDGIVLVARANYTTTEDVAAGMGLLKDKNVLGIVLNDAELHKGWTY